jgi:hypothetical protein
MHRQKLAEALSLKHRRLLAPVTPFAGLQACSADVASPVTCSYAGNVSVCLCIIPISSPHAPGLALAPLLALCLLILHLNRPAH